MDDSDFQIARKDLIESLGVLHHLADPWEGWDRLLALLRPGGVMMLGLYSQPARRSKAGYDLSSVALVHPSIRTASEA